MDSKLLIGPVFPTPDPTSRAPWNITSISPRRPMELSSIATTVSIALQLLISPFLFKWLSLDCTGEPLRVASMRKGGENVNQPTQMGKKTGKGTCYFFHSENVRCLRVRVRKVSPLYEWMNRGILPMHAYLRSVHSARDLNESRSAAQIPSSPVVLWLAPLRL